SEIVTGRDCDPGDGRRSKTNSGEVGRNAFYGPGLPTAGGKYHNRMDLPTRSFGLMRSGQRTASGWELPKLMRCVFQMVTETAFQPGLGLRTSDLRTNLGKP